MKVSIVFLVQILRTVVSQNGGYYLREVPATLEGYTKYSCDDEKLFVETLYGTDGVDREVCEKDDGSFSYTQEVYIRGSFYVTGALFKEAFEPGEYQYMFFDSFKGKSPQTLLDSDGNEYYQATYSCVPNRFLTDIQITCSRCSMDFQVQRFWPLYTIYERKFELREGLSVIEASTATGDHQRQAHLDNSVYAVNSEDPISWFIAQFEYLVTVTDYWVYDTDSNLTPSKFSYRLDTNRDWTPYREDSQVRVFFSQSPRSNSKPLRRPFLAKQLLVEFGYGVNLQSKSHIIHVVTHPAYDFTEEVNDKLLVAADVSANQNIELGGLFTLTQIKLFNYDAEIAGFTLAYRNSLGQWKVYNDDIEETQKYTVFIGTKICIRRVNADAIRLHIDLNMHYEEGKINVEIHGRPPAIAEHFWGLSRVDNVGPRKIYANQGVSLVKHVDAVQLFTDDFGADFYTRPHLADDGFSLQFKFSELTTEKDPMIFYHIKSFRKHANSNGFRMRDPINVYEHVIIYLDDVNEKGFTQVRNATLILEDYSAGDDLTANVILFAQHRDQMKTMVDVVNSDFDANFNSWVTAVIDNIPSQAYTFSAAEEWTVDVTGQYRQIVENGDDAFVQSLMVFILVDGADGSQTIGKVSMEIVSDVVMPTNLLAMTAETFEKLEPSKKFKLSFDTKTCTVAMRMTFESDEGNLPVGVKTYVVMENKLYPTMPPVEALTNMPVSSSDEYQRVQSPKGFEIKSSIYHELHYLLCTDAIIVEFDRPVDGLQVWFFANHKDELLFPSTLPLISLGAYGDTGASSGQGVAVSYNATQLYALINTPNATFSVQSDFELDVDYTVAWDAKEQALSLLKDGEVLVSSSASVSRLSQDELLNGDQVDPWFNQDYLRVFGHYHSAHTSTRADMKYLKLYRTPTPEDGDFMMNSKMFEGFGYKPRCTYHMEELCNGSDSRESAVIRQQLYDVVYHVHDMTEFPPLYEPPSQDVGADRMSFNFLVDLPLDRMKVEKMELELEGTAVKDDAALAECRLFHDSEMTMYNCTVTKEDPKLLINFTDHYNSLERSDALRGKYTLYVVGLTEVPTKANLLFEYKQAGELEMVYLYLDGSSMSESGTVKLLGEFSCLSFQIFTTNEISQILVKGVDMEKENVQLDIFYPQDIVVGEWKTNSYNVENLKQVQIVAIHYNQQPAAVVMVKDLLFTRNDSSQCPERKVLNAPSNNRTELEKLMGSVRLPLPVYFAASPERHDEFIDESLTTVTWTDAVTDKSLFVETMTLVNGETFLRSDSAKEVPVHFTSHLKLGFTIAFWATIKQNVVYLKLYSFFWSDFWLRVDKHTNNKLYMMLYNSEPTDHAYYKLSEVSAGKTYHFTLEFTPGIMRTYVNAQFAGETFMSRAGSTSDLKDLMFSNVMCFQVYDLIFPEHLRNNLLVCPKDYVNFCADKCLGCNQVTGEQFQVELFGYTEDEDAYCFRRDYDMSPFLHYFPVDADRDSTLSDQELTTGHMREGTDDQTYWYKNGVVGNAICYRNPDRAQDLIKDLHICKGCTVGMWIRHECSKKWFNLLFHNPRLQVECFDYNSLKTLLITDRGRSDATYYVEAKGGLWYHLSIKYSNPLVTYINGEVATSSAITLTETPPKSRSTRSQICFDEIFITDTDKEFDTPTFYNLQLYGNRTLENARVSFSKVFLYYRKVDLDEETVHSKTAEILKEFEFVEVLDYNLELGVANVYVGVYIETTTNQTFKTIDDAFSENKAIWWIPHEGLSYTYARQTFNHPELIKHHYEIWDYGPAANYGQCPKRSLSPWYGTCMDLTANMEQLYGYATVKKVEYDTGTFCYFEKAVATIYWNVGGWEKREQFFKQATQLVCGRGIFNPKILDERQIEEMSVKSSDGEEVDAAIMLDNDAGSLFDDFKSEDQWLQTDLGDLYVVYRVYVYTSQPDSLAPYTLLLSRSEDMTDSQVCFNHWGAETTEASHQILCQVHPLAQYVRLTRDAPKAKAMSISEFRVHVLKLKPDENDPLENLEDKYGKIAENVNMTIDENVMSVEVPQEIDGEYPNDFVTKVFVKFYTPEEAILPYSYPLNGSVEMELTNTHFFNYTHLQLPPYQSYTPCFRVATQYNEVILESSWSCKEPFTSPEQIPVEHPKVKCVTKTTKERGLKGVCTFHCNNSGINKTNWHGVPHSFAVKYSDQDAVRRYVGFNFSAHQFDGSRLKSFDDLTFSEEVMYNPTEGGTFEITGSMSYLWTLMLFYGRTQGGGKGEGRSTSVFIRSCEGPPQFIPEIISIDQSGLSEDNTVVFKMSDRPTSVDMWNMADITNGTYWLYTGHVIMNETFLQYHVAGENETKEIELTIGNISEAYWTLQTASLQAHSVDFGESSPVYCWLPNYGAPLAAPNVTLLEAVSAFTATAQVHLDTRLKLRGENRTVKLVVNSVEPPCNHKPIANLSALLEEKTLEHLTAIQICNDSDLKEFFEQESAIDSPFVVSGLCPWRNYNFSVMYCNDLGCGPEASEHFLIETDEWTPFCGPPFELINITSTSMNVSWQNASDTCANGIITEFRLVVVDNVTGVMLFNETLPDDTRLQGFEELEVFHKYCFSMSAFTSIGEGVMSSPVCRKTLSEAALVPPTLTKNETTGSEWVFNVQVEDMVNIPGELKEIVCQVLDTRDANNVFENFTFIMDDALFREGNHSDLVIAGLWPLTLHKVRCTFVTRQYGPLIETFDVRTGEDVPYAPPLVSISSESANSLSILVTQDVPPADRNGELVGYEVCYKPVPSLDWVEPPPPEEPVLTASVKSQVEATIVNGSYTCMHFPLDADTNVYVLPGLHRDGIYAVKVGGNTEPGVGVLTQTIVIATMEYVNGSWSEWGSYGFCSEPCEGGIKISRRVCNNPEPTPGGDDCHGSDKRNITCNEYPCAGPTLAPLGEGNCSKICEGRNFLCVADYKIPVNITELMPVCIEPTQVSKKTYSQAFHPYLDSKDSACYGYHFIPDTITCVIEDFEKTYQRVCICTDPGDIGYGDWAPWGLCNNTCHPAVKRRTRECETGPCTGPPEEYRDCPDLPPCPVDGGWSDWSELTGCTKPCGNGNRWKVRRCNNPTKVGEGEPCHGPNRTAIIECNVEICPIHGDVSPWTFWGLSEASCGETRQERHRYCNNPTPAYRGLFCTEHLQEWRPITLSECEPVIVWYGVHFTDWEWDWTMYNIHGETAAPIIAKANQLMAGIVGGYPIKDFHIYGLRHGSVIVDYEVTYEYVNGTAIVNFVDEIIRLGKMGNESVNQVVATSPTIPCPPPEDISVTAIDSTSVRLDWLLNDCFNENYTTLWLYLTYTVHDQNRNPWYSLGVNKGDSYAIVKDLSPATKYRSYFIPAINTGSGVPSKVFYMETLAEPPSSEPLNMLAISKTSREIFTTWDHIPEDKRNGKLIGYRVKYKKYFDLQFSIQEVHAQFVSTALKNLKPYTLYIVEVVGYNVAGESPPVYEVVKTLEDVPEIPVPNIHVYTMRSIDWWAIAWGQITREFSNGILLGYRLVYYMSWWAGEEVGGEAQKTDLMFDNYTFFYKALHQPHYAIYNVSVMGFTAAGNGPYREYQAQTCNCRERLIAYYYELPPFTDTARDGSAVGFLPPLVRDVVVEACGGCLKYKRSHLYFNLTRTGVFNDRRSEFSLRKSIDQNLDVSFPIYSQSGREVAPNSVFIPVVTSPGCAFIVRNSSSVEQVIQTMIMNVLMVWPLLLISYLIATAFGILIWFTDQFANPGEFSVGQSLKGPCVGFWFSFVTMTTVGYGDMTPRSVLARSISMFWFLVGLILNGIIIGFITTAVGSLNISESASLYGVKTAALSNSFEYRYAVMKSAEIANGTGYLSINATLEAVNNHDADVALVDVFSMMPYRQVLKDKNLKVTSIMNTNSAYGFVLSGLSEAMYRDVIGLLKDRQSDIAEFSASMIKNMPPLSIPGANEATSDVFSPDSPAFHMSMKYMLLAILICSVLGLCCDLVRCLRRKFKVNDAKQDKNTMLLNLSTTFSVFNDALTESLDSMSRNHVHERFELMAMKQSYKRKLKFNSKYDVDRHVSKSFKNVPDKANILNKAKQK